jgi:hypothetical protein
VGDAGQCAADVLSVHYDFVRHKITPCLWLARGLATCFVFSLPASPDWLKGYKIFKLLTKYYNRFFGWFQGFEARGF